MAVSVSVWIGFGLGPVWSQELSLTDNDVRLPGTRGNPLWGLTLDALPATADRPIFSPARRPPAVAAVAPHRAPQPTMTSQSSRPALSLLGVIAADAEEMEGVAVFLDATTNAIIRMKPGESYTGWTLQSVKARQAILQRGGVTVTVVVSNPAAK